MQGDPTLKDKTRLEMESLFIILFVLRLLEDLQALNGSCSAFTTHQDRKRHLSTFRTIQVATE
jgi:hypothetical protein